MKTLKIIYPDDFIERARKHDTEVPVRKLFFVRELSIDLPDTEKNMIIWKCHYHRLFNKHS